MTANESRDPIMEIDLLAYADGFLDSDPARKRAVEAFLRDHPAEAERVHAYIEQNREIRILYGPVIAEPLPDRLVEVLHRQRSYGSGRWVRAAASVAVLAAAAAGGWIVGFEQHPVSPAESFVEQVLAIHPQMRQAERTTPRIDLASAGGALHRLPEGVALEADPPDLSSLGYTFRDRRVVGSGGKQMVQMTYVRSDGRRLSLFLGNRTQQKDRKIVFSENGDVTMAHWLDGPTIYGVVAKGGERELEAVAETIQAATRHARRGAATARIAAQGGANAVPIDDTVVGEEISAPRLVTPEPAVAAPRERIGPIRATR
jgi:anti-sigma factor RsiW